ncbi:MAG: type I-C CRISPR-associated protein Cas5c [Helicobacteraceae bacterium]|jgi:CRISPR-associated protein Cas5d|nr:type I-C CRISPR-associated protein Cas5c [Helicobacteraceae bacterium]
MNNWRIEVWGDYACFTRPEMKVERVSYDVMTPSAARAIFDAILWKPAISWQITKIEVLNPIQWVSARRNEVGKIATAPTGIFIEDHRQQRAGLFLKDVRYRIHGRFDFIPPEKRKQTQTKTEADNADESEAKYAAMFERRARKGQCFHRPYLGCREFACYFRLVEGDVAPITETINPDRDLGWMLYDMNYANPSNPTPEFFHARLKNNAINTDRQTLEIKS